ncbi:uncharacterized protein LOC128744467 [Sabethes cyaneus]|uniref:uncharacterized protein LOC128744467 n=1 Tax=Sabethes cyaneus TaxID=53552 RepID=UPI00237D6F86|nr:uncharacterized protein LOC128744467 [Sabethes cyaneus]
MDKLAKTISGGKQTKTIRNVLVQPFKTKWPILPDAEVSNFQQLFKQVPQHLLVRGINETVQLIHEGKACVLLINSNFHPQILAKQLIRMARRNLPDIKTLAIENLRLQSSAEKIVAIRRSDDQEPESYHQLLQLISNICISNGYEDGVDTPLKKDEKQKIEQKKSVEEIEPRIISQIYLIRHDSNRRVFVPKISIHASPKKQITENDWGEYVSFEQPKRYNTVKDGKRSQNSYQVSNMPYVPLTVNRVQGNPDRKRKKK